VLRETLGSDRPTYIRIGKKGEKDLAPLQQVPKIGHGLKLTDGRDLCILAVGTVANEALAAAEELANEGIQAEVILVHTVKPTPVALFEDITARFKSIITVEEHSRIGGFGESLLSFIATHGLVKRIKILGTSDQFLPTIGSQSYARKYFGINAAGVAEAARSSVN
jgi:transketolase